MNNMLGERRTIIEITIEQWDTNRSADSMRGLFLGGGEVFKLSQQLFADGGCVGGEDTVAVGLGQRRSLAVDGGGAGSFELAELVERQFARQTAQIVATRTFRPLGHHLPVHTGV
jgi:hypothetical protein